MTNPVNFSSLDRRNAKIGGRATFDLINSLVAFQNALCETVSGKPAQGNPSHTLNPHNHTEKNGVTLPRGVIFCADYGGVSQADFHTTTGSGFESFHSFKPSFWAFVTPEVDGGNSREAGSGATRLYSSLLVKTTAYDFDLYLRNETLGASSSTKTATASSSWQEIEFTDVPCVGGIWNSFSLFVDGGGSGRVLYLLSLHLIENRFFSQPQSAGSSVFLSL